MLFPHFAIVLATICLLNQALATAIRRNAATLPNGVEPSAGCQKCQSSLSFAGAKAKEYAVGTQIPGLPFKTKNSWAGNIPIESEKVKNGSLFMWMWGKDDVISGEDLIIWIGSGCSALTGLSHENGPFHIQETAKDTTKPNEYSWTKVSNIVYVEQPANTGFSTGRTYFTNETQIAKAFVSFLKHFYEIFPELKAKKLWIAGRYYGGLDVVHILNELYNSGQTPQLQGTLIIDGVFTPPIMLEPAAYPYAVKHQAALKLSAEDLQDIKDEAAPCNLVDYVEKNLHYPAQRPLPDFNYSCSPYTMMYARASDHNQDLNIENINKPNPSDDEHNIDYTNKFFDNAELQKYIHAPKKNWRECDTTFLSGDGDRYPDRIPDQKHSMLAQVIEKSKKYIMINGNLDAEVMTDTTALAFQNLTWAGGLGFKKPPVKPLYDIGGKQTGSFTEERGLTFAQIFDSGQVLGQDQPATAFAAVLNLLGKKDWSKK